MNADIEKRVEELKHQWGYSGKPKQWQDGFDAGMRELTKLAGEMWTDDEMMEVHTKGFERGTLLKELNTGDFFANLKRTKGR